MAKLPSPICIAGGCTVLTLKVRRSRRASSQPRPTHNNSKPTCAGKPGARKLFSRSLSSSVKISGIIFRTA